MKAARKFKTDDPVSEMTIVDTFTKLIFGEDDEFSASEELIIKAFRLTDTSVELRSHKDMGNYLRVLGVEEMIQLVTRVHQTLSGGLQGTVVTSAESVEGRRAS